MPPKGWKKPVPAEGAAPAVTAVRHDPEDAPIDGDYTKDVVFSRDPGKKYFICHPDDMPMARGRGYVRTERTPDGARPAYDIGDETTAGYQVDNLTLLEIPVERADAIQARAERRGNQIWEGHQVSLANPRGTADVGVRTDKYEHSVSTQ